MRIREAKWHQTIKNILMEIGERNGFDISESEREMYFTTKFALFEDESRKKHTLTYKPDVVWKKGIKYHAIFEIEYLNPRGQIVEKKKYSLGTLILGLIASCEKSCRNFTLVTNRDVLCKEIATCFEILDKKKILGEDFKKSIIFRYYSFDSTRDKRFKNYAYLKKELEEYVSEDFKL